VGGRGVHDWGARPLNIQIFGIKNDSATRKALRFFQERRIQVHFVDFKIKGPSKGELTRFAQKFGGAEALIDRDSKRFKALGLGIAHYGDARWMEIALDEPMILRTPLVRNQSQLTVGLAEADWKGWVKR
jgi:arsenate reductase